MSNLPGDAVGTHQAGRRTAINGPRPLPGGGRGTVDPLQSGDLCGPLAKALADMARHDRCRADQTGTTGASRRQVAGSAHKNFWRVR